MMPIKTHVRLLAFLIIFLLSSITYAVQTHTKFWTAFVFVGPFSESNPLRYYVEQDTRFVDDKYKFQQALLWLGLGYKFTPTLTFYAGGTENVSRNYSGFYIHEKIAWEQLSWLGYKSDFFKFISNSRFEEIKRLHEAQWQILLRQQQVLKFPLQNWKNHALLVYDSVFFNLRNATWSNANTFISQNRAFIGIQTNIDNSNSYTIGYMNQYILSNPNQMNHIFLISFNVDNDYSIPNR